MSIVCQKCRRIIRQEQIDVILGKYFCTKCNNTFRLPIKKEILPILPENSLIKIIKSDSELVIDIPPVSNERKYSIYFGFLIPLIMYLIYNYRSIFSQTNKMFLISSIIIFVISTIILFISLKEINILTLNKNKIRLKRFLFSEEKQFSEIINFSEIEVVPVFQYGYSSEFFVEILFEGNEHFKFGDNLTKQERQYVIDELKLMYFKLKKENNEYSLSKM